MTNNANLTTDHFIGMNQTGEDGTYVFLRVAPADVPGIIEALQSAYDGYHYRAEMSK